MKYIKPITTLSLAILVAACSGKEATTQSPTVTETYNPELWPKNVYVVEKDPAIENRISQILSKMSVEEKVGHIIQPEIKYATPEDVKNYHIGSVLNGGGTYPNNNKFSKLNDWVDLANEYYLASMDESDGKIGIPVLWGSDAVHGHNNVIGATLFPHNIGLGAADDIDLIQRIGEATALEVKASGIDWTFAPTVAVAIDVRWGRSYESYSENPDLVAAYSKAMVAGLQGKEDLSELTNGKRIISTVKHYLGDGGTEGGVDRGDTQVSEKELVDVHAQGFIDALEHGVQTVMASFNSWNGTKMHGHKYLLTDILKDRMGFDGFVVGDWNGHKQVAGCTVTSCPNAINAGLDMFMVPSDWKELYKNTLKQVQDGEIPMARLDDAVSRILRVKLRAGLFEMGEITQRVTAGNSEAFGSAAHRELAREAVRKSLVLLKNNDRVLPVSGSANILVVGDGADNISKQSGGWSISWQGTGNANEDYVGATSIFAGIKAKAERLGGEAVLADADQWRDAKFANGEPADIVIAVYGEEPYAEWHGDITSIEYQHSNKTDLALLRDLKSLNVPISSVFISGRPIWVNAEINASDAFVAAWLPGSEGAGIADVLLRGENDAIDFDFTGKLPFSWPVESNQSVLHNRLADYKPLFATGYGLSSSDASDLAENLSEKSQQSLSILNEQPIFVSRPIDPWQIVLRSENSEEQFMLGNWLELGEEISAQSVEKVSQEDSRKFIWTGKGTAEASFKSKHSVNLLNYWKEDSALVMEMRVDVPPSSEVIANFSCGIDCRSSRAIGDDIKQLPVGEWTPFSIDFRCLFEEDQPYQQIEDILGISSSGELALSIANLKLVSNYRENTNVTCQ